MEWKKSKKGKSVTMLRKEISFLAIIVTLSTVTNGEGAKEYISSHAEFLNFANNINGGLTYEGTTVFLTSDIDLSGEHLDPIGFRSKLGGFAGTLDGLGHTVYNMIIDSIFQSTGLFASSGLGTNSSIGGATVRNLVIGSGSSILNTFTYPNQEVCIGSIFGEAYSINHPTIIENCINMASITYVGESFSYIGGLIGHYGVEGNQTIIRNCVNYGDITSNGLAGQVGGLVGAGKDNDYGSFITNSINYGNIVSKFTSPKITSIGGIIGASGNVKITLCISMGTISVSEGIIPLSIMCGYTTDGWSLENNFYSDKVGFTQPGLNYMFFEKNLTLAESGLSVVETINELLPGHLSQDLASWIGNEDKYDVVFKLNEEDYITLNSSIILLPSPVNNYEYFFDGWYTNNNKITPFENDTIIESITLYATFNSDIEKKFTVTLISDSSVVYESEELYGSILDLPMNVTKKYHSILGWAYNDGVYAPEHLTIPGHNVTLYAVWALSQISTPSAFIEFANNVASGTVYEGMIVSLEDDIDMSTITTFSPISSKFRGTFDGKGHVIKNLSISSTKSYVGLFEGSLGSNIMNVILDDSCSFTKIVSTSSPVFGIGGILGLFTEGYTHVVIKNCIFMGTLNYTGTTTHFYIGGIIGLVDSASYKTRIKNCAFKGKIFASEGQLAMLGGIIGYSMTSVYTSIENCLSNGYVSYTGTQTISYGGIVGLMYTASDIHINNCVVIEEFYSSSNNLYYGRFIGLSSYSYGVNFWSGSTDRGSTDGYSFGSRLTTTQSMKLGYYSGNNIVNALNTYCQNNPHLEFSPWIGNINKNNVKFTINDQTITSTSSLILTPRLGNNQKYWFNGWYKDEELNTPFSGGSIKSDTELYATYEQNNINTYTITLIFYEGINQTFELKYGDTIDIPPNVTRDRYMFLGWVDETGGPIEGTFTVSTYNATIRAKLAIFEITTAHEFREFVETVNTGSYTYTSKTVSLENDIVFPEGEYQKPIGELTYLFNGTFDGKGHVISNHKINEVNYYLGLFGVMYGGSIMNVILDGSCGFELTIPRTGVFSNIYVGSIIGTAYSIYSEISIKDCLNMGTIKYSGGAGKETLYTGGIGGAANGVTYEIEILRCANYGPIIASGNYNIVLIGGITGYASSKLTIVNCLNNGKIRDESTSKSGKYIGGIAGYGSNFPIKYSVSYGNITSKSAKSTDKLGPIIGNNLGITTEYNYYCETVGYSDESTGTKFNKDFKYDEGNIIGYLNGRDNKYAVWSLVTFNYTYGMLAQDPDSLLQNTRRSTSVSDDTTTTVTYIAIKNHIPPIALSEKPFVGWFMNDKFNKRAEASGFASTTTIHAGYRHNATFYDGDTPINSTSIDVGDVVNLPLNAIKTCHSFCGWTIKDNASLATDDEGHELMPNHDIAYNSEWNIIKHNADILEIDEDDDVVLHSTTEVDCGSSFDPNTYRLPERPGYYFKGWSMYANCTGANLTLVVSDVNEATSVYMCWELIPEPSSSSSSTPPSSSSSSMNSGSSQGSKPNNNNNNNNHSEKINKDDGGGGTNVGVIVGPIVGVIVLAAIIVAVVLFFVLKKKSNGGSNEDGIEL